MYFDFIFLLLLYMAVLCFIFGAAAFIEEKIIERRKERK